MLDKLVGKDGLLWRTSGGGDDAQATTPAPAPQAAASTPVYSPSAAAVDPEILASTRKATFEIAGSIYARFAAESENLKEVLPEPTTRIKAVVKTLRVSPAEIVKALSTTHRAALDAWKTSVARAREVGHAEKIGAREQALRSLNEDNVRVQSEIAKLQQQLQSNTEQARTITQEIASAQTEIDQKARQYEAAIGVTEAELAQIISTLQSIT